MKYKYNTILQHFHDHFRINTVRQMHDYESRLHNEPELLTNDEMTEFYLMQLGAMPSEIGVEYKR
jgi:hypothetical protein